MPNIPPEVWSDVFLRVVESDPMNLASLMFVSRSWYRIASNSPRLWARLVFKRLRHFTSGRYHNMFSTKSATLPLDVLIDVPPEVQGTVLLRKVAANYLRKHVSRFRTLELRVSTHQDAEDLVSLIGAQPAPLLESLVIEVAMTTWGIRFVALGDAFQPAPCLTHLTLPVHPLPPSSSLLSTITSLTLDAFQYGRRTEFPEILQFLASIPRLECFTFKGSDNDSYFNLYQTSKVPMPYLTSVDVSVPGRGLDLLCCLRAPLLRLVRYDGWRDEEHSAEWDESFPDSILESLQLLSRESPAIESIELRSTWFPNATMDYPWLLHPKTFPRLEVLRLDSSDITNDALFNSPRNHPNLKRLEVRHCTGVTGRGLRHFVDLCKDDFQVVAYKCKRVTQRDNRFRGTFQVVKVEST
jgi:hypothetical protein